MISRTEAERAAAAIHAIRPDWPLASLYSLITRDLHSWPFRDLVVGLTWVAADQAADGSWVSQTPGRVRGDGPWRTVGIGNADLERQRDADRVAVERRLADQDAARRERRRCTMCGPDGYLPNGPRCSHDPATYASAEVGLAACRAALDEVA